MEIIKKYDKLYFDTKKIIFAQTRYFSGEIRKNNLRGAQEPQHAPDFSLWVLDNWAGRLDDKHR